MLIILEGPDNAGKTWLATRLAEQTDGEIRHWGPIKDHPLTEYELPLQDYVPGSGQTIICDRLHLGEAIYGPLYRGQSRLDPISRAHIEAFLNSRGAVLVHVSEGLAVLRQRHRTEGETFLQLEHLAQVVEEYERVVEASDVQRKLTVHTRDTDTIPLVLQAGAQEELGCVETYRLVEGRYVGSQIPALLLVGEKRNLDHRGFTSPFVPMPATSGHYLLWTLHNNGVRLRGLGLVNAVEDWEHLAELHQLLESPPIVTLGGVAHRLVDDLSLSHGAVQHPQWVRRFANGHSAWYARQIAKASRHQTNLMKEQP